MNECFDNELYGNDGLKSNAIFAGSTRTFMNTSVGDNEFLRFKPSVGDLDIFVPQEKISLLNCIIDDTELANTEIIGKVRSGLNISMLVRSPRSGVYQIDFIPAKFVNGRPSEWDRFSHSSAWIDVVHGFKGSIHKIALSSIAAIPEMFGFEVNMKGEKIKYGALDRYSFSVVSGHREKYLQVAPNHYRAIKKATDTTCMQDLDGIFHKFFGTVPTLAELRKFYTFMGLCELVKEKLPERDIQKFVSGVTDRLYGSKSRTLGSSAYADALVKDPAIQHLRVQFPAVFTADFENALRVSKFTFRKIEFKETVDETGVLSGAL